MENRQINEAFMLGAFKQGEVLLSPLIVRSVEIQPKDSGADARLQVSWGDGLEVFTFVVESKLKANPQMIQAAVIQAKKAAKVSEFPMIQVPYLAPEKLAELEKSAMSGLDLCGNGVVIVPGKLWVMRSGAPNRYPDTRPLNNPYRGRSAMVGRSLLERRTWPTLSELSQAITCAGVELSLPQVSKAVQAMTEDLILGKNTREIQLQEPSRLLDRLGREWRKPKITGRQSLRIGAAKTTAVALNANPSLKWAYTGEASAIRYAVFSQGGPVRLAVSDITLAQSLLEGTPESVPNFADIELIETEEAGFYFGNEIDGKGERWASRVQTWLELQAGDARQQDVAKDLRSQIMERIRP